MTSSAPPVDRRAADEAVSWFARLRGGASGMDHAAFAAWRDADPENARAFREVEALWAATGMPGQRVAEEQAGRLAPYLAAMDAAARKRRRRRRAAGALVLLAALGSGGAWLYRPGLLQDLRADIVSARGERRLVQLPDGSEALLDGDTALSLDYGPDGRRLRLLRGAASFNVRHDMPPFVVQAAGGDIRDIGTRFDVRLVEDGAVVTVAEGSVAVRTPGRLEETVLQRGYQMRYGAAAQPVDLGMALSWHDGRLTFYQMPLAEVLQQLGQYFPGRIVILGGRLAALRVSGSLNLDRPEAALASLQASVGFTLRRLGPLALLGP